MGANQSNSGDVIPSSGDNSIYHQGNFKGYHHSSSNHRPTDRRNKEKPSPPKKPVATDVGSNSITLSWSAPRSTACNSIIAYTLEMAILSPASDRQWRTVTKCCQGTSYDVRHLDPDTGHVFRVRAENVYGVSKPSPPSDVITTRMYEEPRDAGFHCDPVPACSLVDTTGQNFKRRHSFNVHLDGGITKILNHTDIVLTPATLSGSGSQPGERSLSRNSIHRTSLQNNRKISQPILLPGTGTNSLNRLRESRTSLKSNSGASQTNRPREINRNKFRDSRGSSGSTISESNVSTTSTEDLKKIDLGSLSSLHSDTTVSNCRDLHSDSGSKNISVDSFSDSSDRTKLTCSDSVDTMDKLCLKVTVNNKDVICEILNSNNNTQTLYDNKQGVNSDCNINACQDALPNFEITVEKLHIHDLFQEKLSNHSINSFGNSQTLRGYYDNLESPWEKSESLEGVSQQIMAAPVCDDVKVEKMALIQKNFRNESNLPSATGSDSAAPPCVRCDDRRDFRSLRSVLQSNNMIVKSSISLPDVAGMVIGDSGDVVPFTKGRLTTIVDADEEEDTVRITTL
ncbi:hypothetical protein Btru_006478 [Bulinus truncatus]|nr:hypothetical protein Btru_006478 [Bulinus truncatus]